MTDDRATDIIRRLSSAFRQDKESNNYKIIKVQADEMDEVATVIEDLVQAHNIELASGASLNSLAELLELERDGLSDNDFRALIAATAVFRRSNGTIADIKNVVSSITGVPVEDIVIHEDGNTSFSIEMSSPNQKAFSFEILVDNIVAAKAAGVAFLADETTIVLTISYEEHSARPGNQLSVVSSDHRYGIGEYGADMYGNPCEIHSAEPGTLTPTGGD